MPDDPTANHMESRMKCLQNMLGVSRYDIPSIQRNYSWDKENAERLISDIESFMASEKPWLFMGPIVELHDEEAEHILIMDGQQRYSTLTIMFCALRDYLWWKYIERSQSYAADLNPAAAPAAEEAEEEEYPAILIADNYQLFEAPEITHENINFTYYPAQDTYPTICDLARWINKTIIVNTDDPENPILRLTLKNDDKRRLQFLQNPLWDTKYTEGLNNERMTPPGRIDPENAETVERGRSNMYNNYDYFLNYFNDKFLSFGTEVTFCQHDGGEYTPVMINQGGEQVAKTGRIHTDQQLTTAFRWFLKFAKEECFAKMALTQIIVHDWPTAYDIFISTNMAGKALTLADLVRAMIISRLHGQEDEVLEKAYENLNMVAEDEDLDHKQEKSFMRAHWISRNADKQSASSIAKLYADEINAAGVERLLEITEEIAEDVAYFNSARNPGTATQNSRIMDHFIRAGCRQHIPLMMAAYRAGYDAEGLMSIHKVAESLYTIHYKARDGSPSKYEALFAEASGYINAGHNADIVVNNLSAKAKQEIFPVFSFDDFEQSFAGMFDDKANWWHYVFRRIEIHLHQAAHQGGGEVNAEYLVGDNSEINLEHILPQSIGQNNEHGQYWRDRFGPHEGPGHVNNLWRIGNLTLLDKFGNQVLAKNRNFPFKLQNTYREIQVNDAGEQIEDEGEEGTDKKWSYLMHTNQLAQYEHWTEDNINARSAWLGTLARQIWDAIDLGD